ncbi:Uma2 family endonuclease [Streptomyces sp. PLK6-54]|uniref:Uma2 family endonuclease n=2 Tax=Actinacidiphila acidipaludis TaxID=2873382 RepID=A0ABS7Q2R7_9ACTN|nr:Uma2 family endonuclease [Streptomyces acidipaludis]
MSLDVFEHLAAEAERAEEGLRFEFLGGKLGVQPMPDGLHGEVIAWLQDVCMQLKPSRLYTGMGLKVETYRNGRAIPDGVLAPRGYFLDAGDWAEPGGVLMTVEVTSYDRDTTQRDRVDKPRAYAEAGVPVFVLVDRDAGQVIAHSKPSNGCYRDVHAVVFGEPITLPEPVGLTLDTQELLQLVKSARS